VYNGYVLSGLLAYTPSFLALWNRGAEYVDRVLRSAKPAQTPVDLVKEYDLHVNLFVARELGLTVAPSLLTRATEVSQPGSNLPVQAR